MNISLALFLAMFVAIVPSNVNATFSIIACDNATGACGAAVATHNLAVGASVLYAEADVGALVTQFETNPHYGAAGLKALKRGLLPRPTIEMLLQNDGNFDGTSVSHRQVGLVAISGETDVFSGSEVLASDWAGALQAEGYAVLGNGLVGQSVVESMVNAFEASSGPLATRLLAALRAGNIAGGQTTGQMSAAILVKTRQGFPFDIDFRVDASQTPIRDLSQLLNFHYARQHIIRAQRAFHQGDNKSAKQLMKRAIEQGAEWDRIVRRAAHLALALNEKQTAVSYMREFKRLNPTWFDIEIRDERYQVIRNTLIDENIITL